MNQQTKIYQKEVLLFESNHIQVYEGIEQSTKKKVFLKIIDDKAFSIFDKNTDKKQADLIFKTGLEIRKQQNKIFGSLAISNDMRIFTPRIIEIQQINSQTCIVTPRSSFGLLSQFIQDGKFFKEVDALLLIKQVVLGLSEMHELGFVHGALCAENVVIRERGVQLNMLCFSPGEFSKITKEMTEQDIECSKYMAPELLLDPSKERTKEQDIWSLGALLARLLRGRHVFQGNSRREIFDQTCYYDEKISEWMEQPNDLNSDFPVITNKAVIALVKKLMSKNPADRPPASELLFHPLLETIKIEMKRVDEGPTLLPGQINEGEEQFAVIRESSQKNEIVGYVLEDICFGFSCTRFLEEQDDDFSDGNMNPQQQPIYQRNIVQFKTIKARDDSSLEKYLLRVEEFSKLNIQGKCRPVGIKAVVYEESDPTQTVYSSIIFALDYMNMGNLEDYLLNRVQSNQKAILNSTRTMHRLLAALSQISTSQIIFLGTIHPQNLFLDSGIIQIGCPLFIDQGPKLAEKKKAIDCFSKEYKQSIGVKNANSDLSRTDIWSFGFIFYRLVFGEPPIFDLQKRPLFPQQSSFLFSDRIKAIIQACLVEQVSDRANWIQLNQGMEEEQDEVGYQLEERVIEQQQQKVTIEDPNFDFRQKDLELKYKMKNMLSTSLKQPIVNESQQQSRFFKRARKNLQTDEMQSEIDHLRDSYYSIQNSEQQMNMKGQFTFNNNVQNSMEQGLNNNNNRIQTITEENQEIEGTPFHPTLIGEEGEDEDDEDLMNNTNVKKFRENKQILKKIYESTIDPKPNLLIRYSEKEESYQLITPSQKGGENLRKIKEWTKASCVVILFFTLFFRKNMVNSWEAIFNRGDMKSFPLTTFNESKAVITNIVTQDVDSFIVDQLDLDGLKLKYGCIDNFEFDKNHTVIDVLRGGGFFFWAFFCFLTAIIIITARAFGIARVGILTIWSNHQNKDLPEHRKWLILAQIMSHLEFTFIYYCHYQVFNFFYYANFNPCFGVETILNGKFYIFDSTKYILSGHSGQFIIFIVCTFFLFAFFHLTIVVVYLFYPLLITKVFNHWIHILLRGTSYLFGCWTLCRIGAFLIFQPTISIDEKSFMSTYLLKGEYQTVFGLIPEIIELMIIFIDLSIEFIFQQIGISIEAKQTQNSNNKNQSANKFIKFKRNFPAFQYQPKIQVNQAQKINSSGQQANVSVSQAALSIYSKRQQKNSE